MEHCSLKLVMVLNTVSFFSLVFQIRPTSDLFKFLSHSCWHIGILPHCILSPMAFCSLFRNGYGFLLPQYYHKKDCSSLLFWVGFLISHISNSAILQNWCGDFLLKSSERQCVHIWGESQSPVRGSLCILGGF